ncbi:MAG: F-box domain-containing protein [Glomeribacter sp. 1016415]|nr:F-box domain-containing protein [Glomeribacter sp. 1016415]
MSINKISTEILFKIIRNVPIEERDSIALVSKKFKAIVDDNSLWKDFIKPTHLPAAENQGRKVFMSNLSARKFEYIQSDEKGRILYNKLCKLSAEQLRDEAKSDRKVAEFILSNKFFYEKIIKNECGSDYLVDILISQPKIAFTLLQEKRLYEHLSVTYRHKKQTILGLKEVALADEEIAKIILNNEDLYKKFLIDRYARKHLIDVILKHNKLIGIVTNKTELCKALDIPNGANATQILDLRRKRLFLSELGSCPY